MGLGLLAARQRSAQVAGALHDQVDDAEVGRGDLPGAFQHHFEDLFLGHVREEFAGDLRAGRQPALAQSDLFVEAGVLDGHAGRHGQRRQDGLVLRVELAAAALLGEVEIAEDRFPDADRYAEKGVHRRVVGRKAGGRRVAGEFGEPQRLGVPDEFAQQTVSGRQFADQRPFLVGDAHRHELVELSLLSDDAEGPVLRVDQHDRGLDDPAQHLGEVQFPAHGQDGLQESLEPVPGATDGFDTPLELVEQFVEPQLRHPLTRATAAVSTAAIATAAFSSVDLTVAAPTGPASAPAHAPLHIGGRRDVIPGLSP